MRRSCRRRRRSSGRAPPLGLLQTAATEPGGAESLIAAWDVRTLKEAMFVCSFVVRQAKGKSGCVVLCEMGCSRCIGCPGASAHHTVHVMLLVLLRGHELFRNITVGFLASVMRQGALSGPFSLQVLVRCS